MDGPRQPLIRLVVVDGWRLPSRDELLQRAQLANVVVLDILDDPATALNAVLDWEPDALLINVPPSGGPAVRLAIEVRHRLPRTHVLVLAGFQEMGDFRNLLNSGIITYLRPTDPVEIWVKAMREPGTAQAGPAVDLDPATLAQGGARLAPNELEALRLAARGFQNKQIADALVVSRHTVDFYLGAVYRKLDVHTRGAAVAVAYQRGLLPLSPSPAHGA